MYYPSCEVRWFFPVAPQGLAAWFASRDMRFEGLANAERVDYYLPLAFGEHIGIKLREGNIEAKHLVKRLGEWRFPEVGGRGQAEHWIKWSFQLHEADGLSRQIIHEEKYDDWIAVAKERLAFDYHFPEGGAVREVPLREWAPEGCQVELTRIETGQKTYYTFGLEAFSSSGQWERNLRRGAEAAFSALWQWCDKSGLPVHGLGFREGISMSYPEFLLRRQV